MLFDQTICAPILTSMFIFSLSALESLNIGNSIEYTRKIFTPIMITNYKVIFIACKCFANINSSILID